MEQKLFAEIRPIYSSSRENPNEIRIRIRMRDLIDPAVFRSAVDMTMKRYPYFCVELRKKEGQYIFAENNRPVVISHSLHGVELNTEKSNYHMIAFSWFDNWIIMDIFHAMTDGIGAYEVIRTLLYYYCSERYHVKLNDAGIRLAGDEISAQEWDDPIAAAENLPMYAHHEAQKALNLAEAAGLQINQKKIVYSVAISESEFMRFNVENEGSPATMVALLYSRAISRLFPDARDPIRIGLYVNLRKALKVPLAHQSLVGTALLEYKTELRDWPLSRQAAAYRGMVYALTREEVILAQMNGLKTLTQMLLSKDTDQERLEVASYLGRLLSSSMTASVSYVGKANYKEAEKYIRDFHLWTNAIGGQTIIEVSAVNGRFTLDIIQPFSNPLVVNAFLNELEENGITYDLQDVMEMELPNIQLPWSE